ncbi:MAG: hypothetical protein R3F17_11760 [Planctomycetota bacterium]
MRVALLLLAWIGWTAGPGSAAGQERLVDALRGLDSPASQVRDGARAWLLGNLEADQVPELETWLRDAGLAGRWALADVLAGHARFFPLAVELVRAPQAEVREVGRRALLEQALAWNPDLNGGGLPQRDWPTGLRGRGGERLWYGSAAAGVGEEPLSQRFWDLRDSNAFGVPLVLDPRAARKLEGRAAVREIRPAWRGNLREVLQQAESDLGARAWLFGWRDLADGDPEGESKRFLVMLARGSATPESGAALLVDWLELCARDGAATDAMQALAQSGWPAAVAWLQSEVRAGRGEYWPGVLAAVSEHRIPGWLTSAEGVRLALDYFAAAPRPDWQLAHLAQALRVLPWGSEDFESILFGDGPPVPLREWLALRALTWHPSPAPETLERARTWLRNGQADPALRRAALALLAAHGGAGDRVAYPPLPATGQLAADAGLLAQALALGQAPPAEAGLWAPEILAVWAWRLGDGAATQRLTAIALAGGGDIGRLRALARMGLAADLAGWLRDVDADPWVQQWAFDARLALGMLSVPERSALAADLVRNEPGSPADWLRLGRLAGYAQEGMGARGMLLGSMGKPVPPELLWAAIQEACAGLAAHRDAVELEQFRVDLRRVAATTGHELVDRILDEDAFAGPLPEPMQPWGSDRPRPPL